MSKKKKNQTTKQPQLNYLSIGSNPLSSEAKKSLTAVILALLSLISLFNLIKPDGLAGQQLSSFINQTLGWGRWFLPIFLMALAIFIYYRQRLKITTTKFIGWGLLFVSLQSIFHFYLPVENWLDHIADGVGGGYLGYGINWAITSLIGYWSSIALIAALFITSLIFIFNTSLSHLIGRQSIFNKFLIEPLISGWRYLTSLIKRKTKTNELTAEEELSTVYTADEEQLIKDKLVDLDQDLLIQQKLSQQKLATEPTTKKTNPQPQKSTKPVTTKVDLPLNLLDRLSDKPDSGDTVVGAEKIKTTLENFDVSVDIAEITVGPTITQYAIKPADGIRLEKITGLAGNLSMSLAAPHPIRIEAPIPGKSLVGIEVPNQTIAMVGLREILESTAFQQRKNNTMIALGKDVTGRAWLEDLSSMPHLLVAGTTGSGKSVMLNCIILSLLYANSPEDLRLIMIDPKRVELSVYNGIPHLLTPVINEASKTINALGWSLNEMTRRLELFQEHRTKDIKSFNQQFPEQKLPYIVFIIDELADLMMLSRKEVEASIIRLAQMSRAAGIHLVLATQRPSVDVITGIIKGNMPARIAFTVASQVDSRTILDTAGAERLMGKGDMLFSSPRLAKPVRIQGAFVSENEIKRVVRFIKASNDQPQYIDEVVEKHSVPDLPNGGVLSNTSTDESADDLLTQATKAVIDNGRASATYLQRLFKIGYPRAASLLDQLEEQGVIGPVNGSKPRKVYISPEEYVAKNQAIQQPTTDESVLNTNQKNLLAEIYSEEEEEDCDDDKIKEIEGFGEKYNINHNIDQPPVSDFNDNEILDFDDDNNETLVFDDDETDEKYFSQ